MSADAWHMFLWGAALIPGVTIFYRFRRKLHYPSDAVIPDLLGPIWIIMGIGVALWGLLCWLMYDVWS